MKHLRSSRLKSMGSMSEPRAVKLVLECRMIPSSSQYSCITIIIRTSQNRKANELKSSTVSRYVSRLR